MKASRESNIQFPRKRRTEIDKPILLKVRSNKYAYIACVDISFITSRQTGCPLACELIPSCAVLDGLLYLKVTCVAGVQIPPTPFNACQAG